MGQDRRKSNNNKKDQKPNRSENLSTTIGDLLKSKGESIPEAKKKDFKSKKKNHNKPKAEKKKSFEERIKESGSRLPKSTKEPPIYFDMHEPEPAPEPPKKEEDSEFAGIKPGSWDELTELFTAQEDPTKVEEEIDPVPENPNTFHVGAEYITKAGTDKRIKISEFFTEKN